MRVFKKGIWKGLNIVILMGGQKLLISISGLREKWKYLQKNLKKNKISLKINNNIPIFKPLITNEVWNPWKVASRIISRHQL